MKKYKVYNSQTFDKELEKHDKSLQEYIDKLEDQLVENPYTGKPLNVRWFREKKLGKYRIYYLIYDDLESVFVVGLSGKKDQQKVINTTGLLLDFLRDEIENIIDKEKLT